MSRGSVNHWHGKGTLQADVEIKKLPHSGKLVVEGIVVTDDGYFDKSRTWHSEVNRIPFFVRGFVADKIARQYSGAGQYRKGDEVYIEGGVQMQTYALKNTKKKKTVFKIKARRVLFLHHSQKHLNTLKDPKGQAPYQIGNKKPGDNEPPPVTEQWEPDF